MQTQNSPRMLPTNTNKKREDISRRTLEMLEWNENFNLLFCHLRVYVPASGSYFADSYRRSCACNGCTWIFDGFTSSSISLRSKPLEIVSCSCFVAMWLWCVDEDVAVCCTVSISNSVRLTPKPADKQKRKRRIKKQMIKYNEMKETQSKTYMHNRKINLDSSLNLRIYLKSIE